MSDEIERLFIGGQWHGKRIAIKSGLTRFLVPARRRESLLFSDYVPFHQIPACANTFSATEYRLERITVNTGGIASRAAEVMVEKSIVDHSTILTMFYQAYLGTT
jgi:hypothetical protein